MAKKVAGTMKLQVPAGQANPSPPVGPALGQRGITIMEICKAFKELNAQLHWRIVRQQFTRCIACLLYTSPSHRD